MGPLSDCRPRSGLILRRSRSFAAFVTRSLPSPRIPPATQASYFRYFTLRMCGTLEFVCGALKPQFNLSTSAIYRRCAGYPLEENTDLCQLQPATGRSSGFDALGMLNKVRVSLCVISANCRFSSLHKLNEVLL